MSPKKRKKETLSSIAAQLDLLQTAALANNKSVFESKERQTMAEANERFAAIIISAAEQAKTVEDLVRLEMLLQEMDKDRAQSDSDRESIRIAQIEYAQIMATLEQMRRSPGEYLAANNSQKETRGNPKIIARGRALQQLSANRARLQNRCSFADADVQTVWRARISLIGRIEHLYRTLHSEIVKASA